MIDNPPPVRSPHLSVDDLAGTRWAGILRPDPSALVPRWTFARSPSAARVRLRRSLAVLIRKHHMPAWRIVRDLSPAPRWNVLFCFVPGNEIHADQAEMMHRLGGGTGKLLVVYAAPTGSKVPAALDRADAVIWKDLPGYDFSAYAIALEAIALRSPGADVFVQNDSVFGPFAQPDALVKQAPWDLTGFVGSAAGENHISSFAFIVRKVTSERIAALSPALTARHCWNRFDDVVTVQELRLARIASKSMSVGAHVFLPTRPRLRPVVAAIRARFGGAEPFPLDLTGDGMLGCPLALIDQGVPFMKRSLFGKYAGVADQALLRQRLTQLGWPEL